MIKALIWKEYREKRLWALTLFASAAVPILLGSGYVFACDTDKSGFFSSVTGWIAVPALTAVLFGLSAFSLEVDRAASFLFTQSVSWKKLILAKLVVGIGVIGVASLLSAALFEAVCPPEYRHLLTIQRLAAGIGFSALLLGAGYLMGLIYSVTEKGGSGGAYLLAAYAQLMFWIFLGHKFGRQVFWVPFGLITGPLIASILVMRFGITVSTAYRAKVFISAIIIATLCLLPLDIFHVPGPDIFHSRETWSADNPYTSISPDGSHALTRLGYTNRWAYLGPNGEERVFSIDFDVFDPPVFNWADSNTVYFTGSDSMSSHMAYVHWANGSASVNYETNTVVVVGKKGTIRVRGKVDKLNEVGSGPNNPLIIIGEDAHGKPRQTDIQLFEEPHEGVAIPSLDGKLAVICTPTSFQTGNTTDDSSASLMRTPPGTRALRAWGHLSGDEQLPIIDIKKARIIGRFPGKSPGKDSGDVFQVWWQSNRQVGTVLFGFGGEKRHFFDVAKNAD